MPRLSVWFIRASLIHLAIGFTFGGLLLINKGIPFNGRLWALLPGHIEVVLLGWILQLVMGMAFWILPRFAKSPARGNTALAAAAFVLVNTGIGLILVDLSGLGGTWVRVAARSAETLGVAAFAAHAWPRVKGFWGSTKS